MSASAYSSAVVGRARSWYEAGWSIPEIRRLVLEEYGREPTWVTVKSWVDPKWAEKRRETLRGVKRRHLRQRMGRRFHRVSDDWKLERMQELREAGLSAWAIGVTAGVWWGEVLTVGQVQRRLGVKDEPRRGRVRGRAKREVASDVV